MVNQVSNRILYSSLNLTQSVIVAYTLWHHYFNISVEKQIQFHLCCCIELGNSLNQIHFPMKFSCFSYKLLQAKSVLSLLTTTTKQRFKYKFISLPNFAEIKWNLNRFRMGPTRNKEWTCCFGLHVRTATIMIGLWHLVSRIIEILYWNDLISFLIFCWFSSTVFECANTWIDSSNYSESFYDAWTGERLRGIWSLFWSSTNTIE